MTSGTDNQPLSVEEADALFAYLEGFPHLAVGVSGGADSLALMHLLARWSQAGTEPRPRTTVLTVDHGVRAEAAAEARQVGEWAGKLGLDHHTLVATEPAPNTGMLAWARAMRLTLMGDWVRQNGAAGLVLAHHAGDQAETLLMRLARGSGLRGLSAMSDDCVVSGLRLLRPLLAVRPERLKAFLDQASQSWIEDPSNSDQKFERVRVRHGLAAEGDLNRFGLTTSDLAASARRLGRADAAIEVFVERCLADEVKIDWQAGYARISNGFLAQPEEIRLRVLARLVALVSGGEAPLGAGLEAALARLEDRETAVTLAGARIGWSGQELLITSETRQYQPLSLAAGERRIWGNRFAISLGPKAQGVEVCALGAQGFAKARRDFPDFADIPSAAGQALPGGFRGTELALLPQFAPKRDENGLMVEFCSRF